MKEKLFKKVTKRKLFSVVLALAMVVALMPINTVMAGDVNIYSADGNYFFGDDGKELSIGDTISAGSQLWKTTYTAYNLDGNIVADGYTLEKDARVTSIDIPAKIKWDLYEVQATLYLTTIDSNDKLLTTITPEKVENLNGVSPIYSVDGVVKVVTDGKWYNLYTGLFQFSDYSKIGSISIVPEDGYNISKVEFVTKSGIITDDTAPFNVYLYYDFDMNKGIGYNQTSLDENMENLALVAETMAPWTITQINVYGPAECEHPGMTVKDKVCGTCGMENPNYVEMLTEGELSWTQKTDEVLSFRSSANITKFARVEVDDKEVAAENYDVTEGSTIVTLKANYLETLEAGKHTISIVSLYDGEEVKVSADFEVKAAPTAPKTGDATPIALYVLMMGLAGAGIVATKKRRAVR